MHGLDRIYHLGDMPTSAETRLARRIVYSDILLDAVDGREGDMVT